MMRIAIHGASGRLGALIAEEAAAAFVGAIGRDGPVPECDAVIDVSSVEGLTALLPRLSGQPLLIGTTGDLPLAALETYAETAPVAVVRSMSRWTF